MNTLFTLLFCTALASWASAQSSPALEPATTVRISRRQPPPMPAGGFWVVESPAKGKGCTIIRFYDDQQRELHADTLTGRCPNIRKRAIATRLNGQLAAALANQPTPVLAGQPPRR